MFQEILMEVTFEVNSIKSFRTVTGAICFDKRKLI